MNSQEIQAILKILNFIARLIPPLAKGIERITNALIIKSPTTQDIIERRLQATSSVKSDVEENLKDDVPTSKQSLESNPQESKATVEEIHSAPSKQSITEINPQDSEQRNISSAVQETFLRQIELDFQETSEQLKRELKSKQSQEAVVFRLMIISAIISLVLIVLGAYLFFQNGLNVLAVLSEILGLMTGSGTAILRQLQTNLRQKAEVIEKKQDEQTRFLRAIQTALALRGPEKDQQLVETAKWLREMVKPN